MKTHALSTFGFIALGVMLIFEFPQNNWRHALPFFFFFSTYGNGTHNTEKQKTQVLNTYALFCFHWFFSLYISTQIHHSLTFLQYIFLCGLENKSCSCASIYHPVHVCTLNKQGGEWTLEMDQLTGLLHSAVCAEREHLISHRTHAIKAQAIGE